MLFQIPFINDKVMDRTRKCDGRTDGAYFYIPLFSSKRRGTIKQQSQFMIESITVQDDMKLINYSAR
jgi:hypothetical protein